MDIDEHMHKALLEMWEEELQEVETEPVLKKSRLQSLPSVPISDYKMIPNIDTSWRARRFREWLPRMSEILWARDFTPLLKFKGSKTDIKYAFEFDFIALCLWFLYIEVPASVKEFAAWALATIYNVTGVDMVFTHQTSVDDFVMAGLCSKYHEVVRQVSCALSLLASCRRKGNDFAKDVTFGRGFLTRLLELVDQHDSAYVVFALYKIAKADKGVRDVIVSAELESSYLTRLLKTENMGRLKYVLLTIACVTRPDNLKWDDVVVGLMPDLTNLMDTCYDRSVCAAVVRVLNSAIDDSKLKQIRNLVNLGCLEILCFHLEVELSEHLSHSLNAIKCILRAGDKENINGNKLENQYAKYIHDNIGWSVFREVPFLVECGAYYMDESHKLMVEYAGEN